MSDRQPVRLVLDVGRTNKKMLVFDQSGNALMERLVGLSGLELPDGRRVEDADALTEWMDDSVADACRESSWNVECINFSGYGATFVHLDGHGNTVMPPEDYLDPFDEELVRSFEAAYGDRQELSRQTASPWLGNLNSGLQLFRLKRHRPQLFSRIAMSLHLPQFLSWHFTRQPVSDLTSVGCHTMLWDFTRSDYHGWVWAEGLDRLMAPMAEPASGHRIMLHGMARLIGNGLHDSSAALIPYLKSIREPFLLLSTGTWSIALNPFNDEPLTADELLRDCLCYLTPEGRPVKAARYFIGPEHDGWVDKIAARFSVAPDFYTAVDFDAEVSRRAARVASLEACIDLTEAYHWAVGRLIGRQLEALRLASGARGASVLCVDGGFSRNEVFMHQLAASLPGMRVFAATLPQASALGAAMGVGGASWTDWSLTANAIP